MSREPRPLPMAPSGCELDDRQLAQQLARYRDLSASVLAVERNHAMASARVLFAEQVDGELLEQTLSIERDCCSFFTLAYDPSHRVLSIGAEPERSDALSALLAALIPAASARNAR